MSKLSIYQLNTPNAQAQSWQMPARADRYWQLRISRNTLLAIIFSILLHLLLLITVVPKLGNPGKIAEPSSTIDVSLAPPNKAENTPAPPPLSNPEPIKPKPPKPVKPQVNNKPVTPTPQQPPVMAVDKPSDNTLKIPRVPPYSPPAPEPAAPTDMMSYINAQRERRRAAEGYTPKDNAEIAARDKPPMTEDEKRDAIIKRNLQTGTNGIFQILSRSHYSAMFSFRGWTSDYSNARRETVEINVGPGEDIDRAIVKKMIAIIRRDYNGDFNWESIRLGHVVILSARPEDNAGLEDFLMKEFFSQPGAAGR